MKKLILLLVVSAIAVSCDGQSSKQSGGALTPELSEKASYSIGYNIGQNLKRDSMVNWNLDVLILGLKQAMNGDSSRYSAAETDSIMKQLSEELQKASKEKAAKDAEANKKEGDKFLEENKAKSGVTVTPSGLHIETLTPGTGTKPAQSDAVETKVKILDTKGNVLLDTEKNGQPQVFKMSGGEQFKPVDEALQTMTLGQKVRLVAPSALAFGDQGNPGLKVGPGQVLVIELELVKIVSGDAK